MRQSDVEVVHAAALRLPAAQRVALMNVLAGSIGDPGCLLALNRLHRHLGVIIRELERERFARDHAPRPGAV